MPCHREQVRAGQRLAYSHRFAHLFLSEPVAAANQLTFHLTDERDRTAEAKQAKAEKVANHFRDPVARSNGFGHLKARPAPA